MSSTPRGAVPEQPQENPIARERYRDPEAQLGGADAVEKTTYVVGEGTDPNARKGEGPSAIVAGHGAPMMVVVVVVVLVVLVALAYLIGAMR
jgi:hypothetical protein